MQPFVRVLTALGDDLAVGQVRYRYRGWNDAAAHPVADVGIALDRIGATYGPVPVVLVGHSMGGRAALRAAGHPQVRGVVALAPWLPGAEPVEQLAGRDLVVLHGTRDLTTSPRASAHFLARAVPMTRRAVCLRVPWSGHGMVTRASLWHRLTIEPEFCQFQVVVAKVRPEEAFNLCTRICILIFVQLSSGSRNRSCQTRKQPTISW